MNDPSDLKRFTYAERVTHWVMEKEFKEML